MLKKEDIKSRKDALIYICKKIDNFATGLLEEGKDTGYPIDFMLASTLVMNAYLTMSNVKERL